MRIISGKFKGKVLAKSDHLKDLRPTTDKNRESLFNIFSSAKFIKEIGFSLIDAKVLDLFCGTGLVAFEAISRGASFAVLVDNNNSHLDIAKKNAEILSIKNSVNFILSDVRKISQNSYQNFDLVFIDPPYLKTKTIDSNIDYIELLLDLKKKFWIDKNSLIVIEFSSNDKSFLSKQKMLDNGKIIFELDDQNSLDCFDIRKYGNSSFVFLKLSNFTNKVKSKELN